MKVKIKTTKSDNYMSYRYDKLSIGDIFTVAYPNVIDRVDIKISKTTSLCIASNGILQIRSGFAPDDKVFPIDTKLGIKCLGPRSI